MGMMRSVSLDSDIVNNLGDYLDKNNAFQKLDANRNNQNLSILTNNINSITSDKRVIYKIDNSPSFQNEDSINNVNTLIENNEIKDDILGIR